MLLLFTSSKLRFRKIIFLTLIIFILGGLFIYWVYPKTSLTVGVHTHTLDSNGQLNSDQKVFQSLKEKLNTAGIDVKFKAQTDNRTEKSVLEFMVNDKSIDMVVYGNFGGKIPENVLNEYRSMGAVYSAQHYFYVKANNNKIKKISDLKGKKIAIWTSPEGAEKPAFTKGAAKASIYSDDLYLENLFKVAGVTPENSEIINVWPNKISPSLDWDIYIGSGLPRQKSDVNDELFYKDFHAKKIKLFQFEDVQAIVANIPNIKLVKVPESALSPKENIPEQDMYALGIPTSYMARADLDPSIALVVAQFLKERYSAPSILEKKNTYPNFSENETFKPHPEAEEFYKHGAPFLSRYLSPTLTVLVMKLILILVPTLTIVWPLIHFIPVIIRFFIRRKITIWYEQLGFIEKNYERADEEMKSIFKKELADLDEKLKDLRFPFLYGTFVQELFIAREHVELVKKKIRIVDL